MDRDQEHQSPNKVEIAVIRGISKKLRQARQLMGQEWSQSYVAKIVGITPQALASYETALDIETIPLWVLKKLAQIYDVSLDWILGLVGDDWELCLENRFNRDNTGFLLQVMVDSQAEAMNVLRQQENKIEAMSRAVVALPIAMRAIDDAFMDWWGRNPDFIDQIGSNKLMISIDNARKAALEASASLTRFKVARVGELSALDPDYARKDPHQPKTKQKKNDHKADKIPMA